MNKITKRIVAGVSAAALLVSAVGVDQLADLFMKTSYAESGSGKFAQSTGFNNLEQDTDGDNYNTGYGLHTNKTATALDDGRTFNVNLESWYVGENPVDVATILDASGSMAWTVDTLEPLNITDDIIGNINKKYNIKEGSLTINDLIEWQNNEDNGGYLPQEAVDLILDKTKTDNSKLSYAGYKYYVYEDRSSVSEFVPLGYWDGGSPLNDTSLIGYYPFENSLENTKGGEAKYIMHAEDTGNKFDENQTPTETIVPSFTTGSSGGKDLLLDDTAANGALLADVQANGSFTVAMRVKAENVTETQNTVNKMPLVYIGKNSGSSITIYRNGDTDDPTHVKVDVSDGTNTVSKFLEVNKVFQSDVAGKDWINISLSYDADLGKVSVNLSKQNGNKIANFSEMLSTKGLGNLDLNGADIIIGGDVVNKANTLPYPDMQMTTFCVFSEALNDDDIAKINTDKNISNYNKMSEISSLTAFYDFGDTNVSDPSHGKLDNLASTENGSLTFIEQAVGGTFSKTEIIPGEAKPEYSSDSHSGDHSLNVSKTADLGSVLLDVHPTSKKYTLTFAIKKNKDSTNDNSKLNGDKNTVNNPAEIMYIGDLNISSKDYHLIRRNTINDNRHLRFMMNGSGNNSSSADINGVFQDKNDNIKWSYITYVFDDGKLRVYKDGEKAPSTSGSHPPIEELECPALTTETINFIIAGLKDEYDGSDILIDDLYVFDDALSEAEVSLYFGAGVQCDVDKAKKTHARSVVTNKDGKQEIIDIAQISNDNNRLGQNPNADERRGWYYVNSASDWADIEGCLASGKQYIGIYDKDKDNGIEKVDDAGRDIATIPSGADSKLQKAINDGDTDDGTADPKKFNKAPENERSIRFYVDTQGHLRCFAWSGSTSKKDDTTTSVDETDIRTFCSLVYEKGVNSDGSKQITKYEALNDALNGFYLQLATESDLSNSAIVRFSTNKAVNNLDMLIMKDWTNWSDEYIKDKNLTQNKYLQNLLIPADGETSTYTTESTAQKIKEYPYVMTGGTYTWTGLKAFYDNMVNKESGRVYDIANDARDKYLIIFTDGRDNTQDRDFNEDGTINETYDAKKEYYNDGDIGNKPDGSNITYNGELAKAWADKLKDEGYTIFCVMMAAGSISPTANETEYKKAKMFVTSLAGGKETSEEAAANYVTVIGSGAGDGAVDNVSAAFDKILKQIQQPRADYTVQDYIDPRFDLVDKDGNLYKLGAGGKITIEKTDGSSETKTVGNIIDSIDEGTTATGLAYTPLESHMVNRTSSTDTTGDDVGTGYIYYDDEKDMYYLRWTKQIIPMENRSFDTDKLDDYVDGKPKYLDVWSATIQLKAKDDFIGGNNILTNGNEAGENLVYSDATIENMTDNPELYGLTAGSTYREKLAVLSGTDRKINAVDAGGVSQAVYGNGIDIPSSGFPRTTVNVRLLPLDANDLNDVIYMGEVVSPTMMLADLENGYMTGSYYLQYLERYAYRLYGEDATKQPLLELLNQWLKINITTEESKTFTIPYIYLPDPEYDKDGKFTAFANSTGADKVTGDEDIYEDLNLRDVTGFITYTWKREDEDTNGNGTVDKDEQESQQYEGEIYDITKDYVVKNTNQIKYNLQLTFTPLKEGDLPSGFTLDNNFIISKDGDNGDKFFTINDAGEFAEMKTGGEWTTDYSRTDYLQAMIQETRTYTPHVMYNEGEGKWVLVDDSTDFSSSEALKAYDEIDQTTIDNDKGTVTDHGVYDWDSEYKEAPGKAQLEGNKSGDEDKLENIKDYYTTTPNNVKMLNAGGTEITDDKGNVTVGTEPVSLAANTTYTKDVVNAALALELFVDGKYLNQTDPIIKVGKTFTFEATRYYDDPIDPPPYDEEHPIGADTNATDGQKYQLTFKVDPESLPKSPQSDTIYKVWATLDSVAVWDSVSNKYISIDTAPTTDTESIKSYLGYTAKDALPIGTYEIKTEPDTDKTKLNSLKNDQFKIGEDLGADVNFKYLKIENDKQSYAYDKFPSSVYTESDTAADITKDGEYLIWNSSTDNSKKNIADNKRVKDSTTDTQTVTFYFGTVAEKKVGTETLNNTKGVSAKDYLKENPEDTELSGFTNDYAKDRLGIIMLSADDNSLAITKKVKNNKDAADLTRGWEFTVTVTPDKDDEVFGTNESVPLDLKWYKLQTDGNWVLDETTTNPERITFTRNDVDGTYTGTVSLKHDEKVVIDGLPEGTWQVVEDPDVFCTPHNDQFTYDEDEWQYNKAESTREDIDLTPASQVNYINEFPYELPSAGGSGTVRYILLGTLLTALGALLFAVLYFDRRKKARK